MKKNKIKLNKTTCAILLSCTLATTSLAGCMKESSGMKCGEVSAITSLSEQLNNSVLESLKSITEIENQLDFFVERLSEEANMVIYCSSVSDNGLIIRGKENCDYSDLSDDFYNKLNLLIKMGDITDLTFNHLDNSFDFSKIDFSNISDLFFSKLSDRVDLSKVDFSNVSKLSFSNLNGSYDFSKIDFSNVENLSFWKCHGKCSGLPQKYDSCCNFSFSNTSLEIAMAVLSNCEDINSIDYSASSEACIGDLKPLLEFLLEKGESMETFNVRVYSGITEEELQLLSQVNTSNLEIFAYGVKKPLNLDLTLHPSICDFSIYLYDTFSIYGDVDSTYVNCIYGQFEVLKINTERSIIHCHFLAANITESTQILLPDHAVISLECLRGNELSSSHNLEKVKSRQN